MKVRATMFNPPGSEQMIPAGAVMVASADFRRGDLGPFGVVTRRVGNTYFSHDNVLIEDHEVCLAANPAHPTKLAALSTGLLEDFDSIAVSFCAVSPIDGVGLCVRLQGGDHAIDLFEMGVAPRTSCPSLSLEVPSMHKVIQTYYSAAACPSAPTLRARVVPGNVTVTLGEENGSAKLVTTLLSGGPYAIVIQTTRTSISTKSEATNVAHVVAAINWVAAWKRGT